MADNDLPDAPWATPQAAPAQDSGLENAPWATPRQVTVTPGQEKSVEDEALTAKYRGIVPDAAKAAGWAAGNAAFMYLPRAASAAYESFVEDEPWKQALKERTEYEDALYRQHPTASMVGTGIGLAGGLAVPLGPIGTLGKAAEAATVARGAAPWLGKVAEGATTGSILSGVSGIAATADPATALKDAAIGAGVGGAAAPVLGALGNYFTKLPAVTDASGNLTAEAERAIDTAFKGKMTADDIASFKTELIAAFEKKGISPEVAREALLTKEGVTPTASLVTGKTAPKSASDIGERAAAEGTASLGERAEEMIGEAPAPTKVAESLAKKTASEIEKAGEVYEAGKTLEGEFPATLAIGEEGKMVPEITQKFIPNIQKSLADRNIPTSFENTGMSYPYAKAALKYMQEGPTQGNFPYVEGLTPKNMQEILKNLNKYSSAAKNDPQDLRAVRAIKDGYLATIKEHVIDPAMFNGDGEAVLTNFQEAPLAWKAMKDIYFPDKGAASTEFRRTVNSFVDQSTRKISDNPTQGMLDTAQAVINTNILNPKVGSAFYERLESALGKGTPEMETVKQHIKSLALDTSGDLSKLPKKIDDFLSKSPTVAKNIFTPKELSDLRRLGEAARITTSAKLSQPEKSSRTATILGKLVSLGIGAATYPFHGLAGAIAGYAGSELSGAAKGAVQGALARRAEAAGAPKAYRKAPESMRGFDQAPDTGSLVRNIPAMGGVGVPGYQEPTTLPPLTINRAPIARASGGRVAAKLVSEVERAKKAVNNRTKVLLDADDSHVARALEIANQNLEG